MQKLDRQPLKTLITKLISEHHQPGELAAATFVGTLIGVSPFFGFHLILAVVAGFCLKLNKVLIYAVANISNPFFAPFIIYVSYQLGSWFWTGEFQALTVESLKQSPPKAFGLWLLGSLMLGSCLGLVFGALVFWLTYRLKYRNHQTARTTAIKTIADNFRSHGRFAAGYASGKLKADPVYARLLDLIPPQADLLDLGGGQGLLALLRAASGHCGSNLVVDYDAKKVDQGRSVAQKLGKGTVGCPLTTFEVADVCAWDAGQKRFDAICLIDVLHYLPLAQQDQLLSNAAGWLQPGGTLYVRDIDASQHLRGKLNYLQETFSLFFGITKASRIVTQSRSRLVTKLETLGLETTCEPCSAGFMYANVLIMAPASSEAPVTTRI